MTAWATPRRHNALQTVPSGRIVLAHGPFFFRPWRGRKLLSYPASDRMVLLIFYIP
jgi:hypothetical protein